MKHLITGATGALGGAVMRLPDFYGPGAAAGIMHFFAWDVGSYDPREA